MFVCALNLWRYRHLGATNGKNREDKLRKAMRKKGTNSVFLFYSSCLVAESFQSWEAVPALSWRHLTEGWVSASWEYERTSDAGNLHTAFTQGTQRLSNHSQAEVPYGNPCPDVQPPYVPLPIRTDRSKNAPALKMSC